MPFPILPSNSASGYFLTKSLRFRSSASAYLNRTPASATNRTTWTWSAWVKRGDVASNDNRLFGAGTSNSDRLLVAIENYISVVGTNSGSNVLILNTTPVYRDPSAWYHIVVAIDTTQATASNRAKIYVNGVQVTAFGTATYPAQNTTLQVNSANPHVIGTRGTYSVSDNFDGYLAEVNFVDGQALTPSSFGETSTTTGVWIPKKYTGTYGTNGFYLPFTNTTSTSTLGNDFSGNSNTWTVNNISLTSGSTYDSMNDVPTLTSATTANYCVMNPLDQLDGSIADGNLNVTTGTVGGSNCRSTMAITSGKFYWEFTPTTNGGIADLGISIFPGSDPKNGTLYTYQADTGNKYSTAGGAVSYGATYTTNDVIGVAFDAATGSIWWSKNGTFQASGDPAAGTNAAFTGITGNVFAFISDRNVGQTCVVACNFGQRPFAYTPPTGFVALNTFNLPTPTIGATASTTANKYMDVLLHNGNGGSQSITGLNFAPDFWWVKSRNLSGSHCLFDQIRGANSSLFSELTLGENNNWTGQSFNSNGVTADAAYSYQTNGSGYTFVDWFWKANGAGSSNTQGSITSTVSANTTSGFSVVTYTGNGTSGATVGHGLGVAPSMYIVKTRSTTESWITYHISIGATNYLALNLTQASSAATAAWNNTAPTSTVFSLGNAGSTNGSGNTFVAYCFAQVAGYSAFGSYTGNGSSDGTFVFTGFRPRFVMTKRTDSTSNWWMIDTARSTYNQMADVLLADSSGAEFASGTGWPGIDYLSNGFKLRGSASGINASGGTYIYMAFAENPFKYANAR